MANKPTHDFVALRRKLSAGKTLGQSAAEAGMPLEVARAHLLEQADDEVQYGDQKLLLWSNKALNKAYRALSMAIAEGSREVAQGVNGPGGSYSKDAVVDVDAAKALLKAGIEVRRLLERKASSATKRRVEGLPPLTGDPGQGDLFDANPWNFKKSDP